MGAREASLKLRLDLGGFGADVKSAEDKVKKSAKGMGSALKESLSAGLSAAGASARGLAGSLKSVVGYAASLGGAASVGAFVHDAINAEEAAGKIAARLRVMGEAGASAGAVLAMAVDQSRKLNSTTEEVLKGYESLLEATGDPVFSREAMASVATFRDTFRVSTEDAASLVSLLREKLGATTDEINNQFGPALLDATSKGGVGIQDLVQNGNRLLAVMPALGLKGADGMAKLVGMLNATDDAGGDLGERMGGLQGILFKFKNPKFLKLLKKDLGDLKFDEGADAVDNFQKVLGGKGGFEALQKMLGASPRTAKMFSALIKPFTDAKEKALKGGKSESDARAIALEALRGRVAELTTVTSTEVTMKSMAAERADEKGRKLELAIDKMRAAFASPEMLGAIDKLAANLPAFAEGITKLVKFATEHPALAATAVVGAQVGGAGVQAAGGALLGAVGKRVLGSAGTAAVEATATTEAAAAVGGTGLAGAGSTLSGVAAAGGAAGAAVVAGVVVAGAAAGGLIGNEIRKAFVDSAQEAQAGVAIRTEDVIATGISAENKGASLEQKKSAVVALQEQSKQVAGSGSGLADFLAEFTVMLGGMKSPEQARSEQIMRLGEQEAALATQIALREQAEKRMAVAAEASAKAMERLTAASANTTRGPAPPPAARPGASPAEG